MFTTETAKALLVALVVYFAIGYINEFVAENQVYYNISAPPLYDRGHNFFPVIKETYANVGLVVFLLYFITKWGYYYPNVLINYLWMISLLFIGRVVILSVTQLPPALPGCSTVKKGENPHFRVFRKSWRQCLDYMYSGHTIHCVLICLFTMYLSTNLFEKTFIFGALLIELSLVIASHMHYTSDVLVATLVSVLIFYSWPGIESVKSHALKGGIYGALLKSKMI